MSELYELPEGWEWKSLNDVCEKITDGAHKSPKTIEKGYPYITVKDVDSNGRIDFNNCKLISEKDFELLTKGNCMPFNGDVLFSKDGTVGKVALVNYETPFVVLSSLAILRPSEFILSEYLQNFLQSPLFLEKAIKSKTGAAIKRVVLRTIKEFSIPLPPLQEQKCIVAKLDSLFAKIDQAIALHQQNMDEAKGFMGSVLNEVFEELAGKYSQVPLFEVANVARGKSKHRPRNDKKLFGGDYPFIQTGDVRNANKYIKTYSNTYSEFGLNQSKLWDKGTICMTIAANIGDVAILDMDSCFPDSVVGIYSDKNSNDFIYYFLLTLKQQLESKATTTAQMNINLKVLQTIGVPLPPLSIQQKTVTYLDQLSQKTEKLKQAQQEKMQSLKNLKASLLDRAFRGELLVGLY